MQTILSAKGLNVVLLTAVYIPLDANVSTALSQLCDVINRQQKVYPEVAFIVAGDFSVLPKFVQGPSKGKNSLDRLYSNLKKAYRIILLPHLGKSDDFSLLSVSGLHSPQEKTKTSHKN